MGGAESRMVHIFNGTRFNLQVSLDGRSFDYQRDGSELTNSTMVRLGNGSVVQIPLPEKYMEITIECRDAVNRQVKLLKFYTSNDVSWVVRNHGVMRPKPGTVGLTSDEDYSQSSSAYFQSECGANWKRDCGDKIRFYSWDVDNEEAFLEKDSEDRFALEEIRVRQNEYGKDKNWAVLSEAHHPIVLKRATEKDKLICKEFIAALQLYTATMAVKLPVIWLIPENVESLRNKKDLAAGWQIQVHALDHVNQKLPFERLILENDFFIFAMIHIQRGHIFSIHSIQEAFLDSLAYQTEVWVADPALDMNQVDIANRNLHLYQTTDCCKYWISTQRKANVEIGLLAIYIKSHER